MRNLLKNCLLLLFLLIISITDVKGGFQIICADKSRHCKRRSDMCQSNAFHSVMQSVCKKTCGLCEDNPKSDILDQYRHKKESDIVTLEVVDVEDGEDKDNFEYSELETTTDQVEEEEEEEGEGEEEIMEELMATLSSTVMPHSVTKNWKQTVCVDSSTDCKRYLCSERMYAHLMRRECPRTCGLCHSGYRPGTPNQIVDGITKDVTRCRDVAPDCNQSLCNHRTYRRLMQTVCKRTCSSCHLVDT
ncbi:ShTK domain containing protein [Brugia malayi]|uniref:Bm6688 n=1 Tax=Brugia malayi TaxID=6279 RepID=A0A0I9R2T7_BRUMA|nr:ShTK domain containing protein [Brugia malayi]CTP80976.1 Bm6688 [Brugia malayi]VIO97460.1 ShTK domain containing protein [Brugia malayi]